MLNYDFVNMRQQYLEYIRVLGGVEHLIEARVDDVEQLHDLHGALGIGVLGAVLGEAHDAARETRWMHATLRLWW